jgi:hypothetical protein
MSTFGTIRGRILTLATTHIDVTSLNALINRVAQAELEARAWSFRRNNTVVNSVAPKADGTVDVTQDSAVIAGTGTSFAAADVGRKLRVGAGANAVGLFTVLSVQSATQLTLTSTYPGTTALAQPYFLFQQFYSIAGADQLVSIQGGNQLNLEDTTHERLNLRDPLRQSTANPSVSWAPYGRDVTNNAQFEFWPINSSAIPYVVDYLAGFTTMVNDTDQPLVPGPVVEARAMADAAMSIFSETGDRRWKEFFDTFWGMYQKELEDAINADSKRFGIQKQIRDVAGGDRIGWDLLVDHDY